jgi:hypothetical protein
MRQKKDAASACNATIGRVKARLRGVQYRPAAGKLLTPSEESGLILWLDRSLTIRLRITQQMIVNECNYILSRCKGLDP